MWQAQFLSYVLLILGNSLFFKDEQMILVTLFNISTGLRFQKILKSFPIQVLSHPWVDPRVHGENSGRKGTWVTGERDALFRYAFAARSPAGR